MCLSSGCAIWTLNGVCFCRRVLPVGELSGDLAGGIPGGPASPLPRRAPLHHAGRRHLGHR